MSLMVLVGIVGFVTATSHWTTESEVAIYKGWNLVYGFVSPDQLNGQALEKQHIKAIYAYFAPAQQYVRMYPKPEVAKLDSLESTYQVDDDILTQSAIWVYSDKTIEGSLNGLDHFTEYWLDNVPEQLNQRPIYKGWNFIGITSDMISNNQDTNLKDIEGNCNIEKSYFYDADRQKWEEAPIEYAQLEERSLGSGWVIKVSDNCKLDASSILPVPSLP
mgnify:CR=1 FL=1